MLSAGQPASTRVYPYPSLPPANDVQAAVKLLNEHRAAAGSPPVTLDLLASEAARAHALYMIRNGAPGHFELPTLPGYTLEGDQIARSSALSLGAVPSATVCVRNLLEAPYHRFGFLEPGVRSVRLAYEQVEVRGQSFTGACVLGIVSVDDSQKTQAPNTAGYVVYPSDGQIYVPLQLNLLESPNPLALCPDYPYPSGLPITVEMQSFAPGLKIDRSILTDALGREIEHCVVNAEQPHPEHNKILAADAAATGWPGKLIIIPKLPAPRDTAYTLRLSGSYGGAALNISSSYTTVPQLPPSNLRPLYAPECVSSSPASAPRVAVFFAWDRREAGPFIVRLGFSPSELSFAYPAEEASFVTQISNPPKRIYWSVATDTGEEQPTPVAGPPIDVPEACLQTGELSEAGKANLPKLGVRGRATVSGDWAPGANFVVWEDIDRRSVIHAVSRIEANSGMTVEGLFLLRGGQWAYFLPDVPVDGGLMSLPPVASIFAVLR